MCSDDESIEKCDTAGAGACPLGRRESDELVGLRVLDADVSSEDCRVGREESAEVDVEGEVVRAESID